MRKRGGEEKEGGFVPRGPAKGEKERGCREWGGGGEYRKKEETGGDRRPRLGETLKGGVSKWDRTGHNKKTWANYSPKIQFREVEKKSVKKGKKI